MLDVAVRDNKMDDGSKPAEWLVYRKGWREERSEVIAEALVSIHVNGQELATIMATPLHQQELALGFLRNEGFLQGLEDVEDLHVSQDGCCVEVWLDHLIEKPERAILTSGCGGGVTFDDPAIAIEPVEDRLCISPEELFELFERLQEPKSLYARARGVHTAALSDGGELLVLAEDVGRHNTIDKVLGMCMLQGIETRGKILLATGRVSSEMLRKGARMGCPLIASRNSPTSMSIEMAQALNITLVGYVRRTTMRVYAHPERMTCASVAGLPVAGD
jgi:FdhD protein